VRHQLLLSIVICVIAPVIANSDEPPNSDPGSRTVRLVGFRELDPDLVMMYSSDNQQEKIAGLPAELFLQAAKASAPVRAAIKKAGKDEEFADLDDWFKAAQSVATSSSWKAEVGSRPKQPMSFKWPGSSKTASVDADLVIGLTASELFGATHNNNLNLAEINDPQGNKVEAILLAQVAASDFKGAYEILRNDSNTGNGAAYCANVLSVNPGLSSKAKYDVGEITFGKSSIYTAKQKNLEIPPALIEKWDVFWLDLFLTVRGLEPNDVEHLKFRANVLPATAISLALIPDMRDKLGIQESLGGKFAESLQKQIEQEPQYRNLKPTIVPGGLRENTLFWTMRSTAIETTSYKFTTILQIPAEIEAIDVVLSVDGRMQKKFLVNASPITTDHPFKERIILRENGH
jgi:hypothetical protein